MQIFKIHSDLLNFGIRAQESIANCPGDIGLLKPENHCLRWYSPLLSFKLASTHSPCWKNTMLLNHSVTKDSYKLAVGDFLNVII